LINGDLVQCMGVKCKSPPPWKARFRHVLLLYNALSENILDGTGRAGMQMLLQRMLPFAAARNVRFGVDDR